MCICDSEHLTHNEWACLMLSAWLGRYRLNSQGTIHLVSRKQPKMIIVREQENCLTQASKFRPASQVLASLSFFLIITEKLSNHFLGNVYLGQLSILVNKQQPRTILESKFALSGIFIISFKVSTIIFIGRNINKDLV